MLIAKSLRMFLHITYLDRDAKEFYIHLGFSINEGKRKFRM